ncbi:MAG TPA: hypothetical protein VFO51_02165 [Sphingomicrobium sp.]|nr:hypothetical protein [Sphingomicrobium sp.]
MIADKLFAPFEQIGRVAMDLGFGGFLEKFENHFGSSVTKVLLVLIGLAVAVLCGSVIWAYLLLPIAQMIPDPRSTRAYEIAKLILIILFFLMITNQLLGLADNYLKRRIRAQMRQKLAEANKLAGRAEKKLKEARAAVGEAKQIREEAKQLHIETGDALAAADLLIERMFEAALEKGMITQEQADELRSLRDKPLRSPGASAD